MIRKTVHAGTFYPRFENQIIAQFEKWEAAAPQLITKQRTLGLILPHAGYIYSGECAFRGFRSVAHESFDSIIVLHPSHQGNHFDYSLSPFTVYESPLGEMYLADDLYEQLAPRAFQNLPLDYHALEHSLEIQLPFLRYFFEGARILPVMIGNQIPIVAKELANSLYDVIYKSSQRILILVSTDLSHYHSAKKAETLDKTLADHFLSLDVDGMWSDLRKGKLEACGIGGIMTLMYFAKKYTSVHSRILHYTHSGQSSGNDSQVVGYLAAKIYI